MKRGKLRKVSEIGQSGYGAEYHSYGSQIEQEGYDLRRIAVELAIPCITSLDTAKEVLRVMASTGGAEHHVEAIQDYVKE